MCKRVIRVLLLLIVPYSAHAGDTASCSGTNVKLPKYQIVRTDAGGGTRKSSLLFIYVSERESYGEAIVAIACDVWKRGLSADLTEGWIFSNRNAAKRWTGLTEYRDYRPDMWALRGYFRLDASRSGDNAVEFTEIKEAGHVIAVQRHVVALQVPK